jgi:predicted alpha-1,6-mannanase (GH76 family)
MQNMPDSGKTDLKNSDDMKLHVLTVILCLTPVVFLPACHGGKYGISSPSYTGADVWTACDAFNQYLLDSSRYIYKRSTADTAAVGRDNGAAAIWCQPVYWDMAINAYRRAKAGRDDDRVRKYKMLCERLFAGNKAHYANFDFDDNNENSGWFIYDDIMWWTITLARAYEVFGMEEYLELSEESFGRVWYGSAKVGDTGSYADPEKGLGGGMFWQWQPIRRPQPNGARNGKMACINFPTVIAALTLYNNVPEGRTESTESRPGYQTKDQYLAKGREIYAWAVENLTDVRTGRVADNRHGKGKPAWKDHLYNQATYIGASVLLYRATGERRFLDNAVAAADYTVNVISGTSGLLPFETGIEQGIYTAIFAQYIAMLVYDCGQEQYIPFIRRNIDRGWANRDKSRDICGGDFSEVVSEGEAVESYAASAVPALMLLFPADKK